MGRAKLNMELIKNEKSRNITFKKRKEGLVRKMHEFSTLCDVDACMIIYGPGAVEPEMWPENPDDVRRLIDVYKSKKKDSGNKTFGLNDFFNERKRRVEDELTKIRKQNMQAKYPTPVKLLSRLTEGQLREFASELRNKAELVKSKIEELKRSCECDDRKHINPGMNSQFYPPVHDMHIPVYYDHMHSINHNSTRMLLMNDGGASSSNGANFQFASFQHQVFYEASMGQSQRAPPLPLYYAPPLPPYMVAPPQMPFSGGWENQHVGREDIVHYYMKNHGG